ncbi:MAG: tail fiber domain-containing protein, partial [Planctomycetota bacterium]
GSVGVWGRDSNTGSLGRLGFDLYGVYGLGGTAGVYGRDTDTNSLGRLGYDIYGVYGEGTAGVKGIGTTGQGVYGTSSTGAGVFGEGSSVGVWGRDSNTGSYGRLGFEAFGGWFEGDGYFSGSVGIGTTNPLSKLSVGADGIANSGVSGYGLVYGVYGSGNIVGAYGIGDNYGVYGEGSIGVEGKDTDANSYGRLGFGAFGGWFEGDGYFSGNVGIGTSSPAARLTVDGAILRQGSTMYGADSNTHINLGTSSTTGTNGFDYSYVTVSGGLDNDANDDYATVGGGRGNTASGSAATVSGGGKVGPGAKTGNTAGGDFSTVGGGSANTASGYSSTVAGGAGNTASGSRSTVPGGSLNTAGGDYSFAAGLLAKANHDGTFVWADSTNADFISSGPDQFLIRASGGVGIGVTNPSEDLDVLGTARLRGMPTGSYTPVHADGTGKLWINSSSRRYKTNIADLETDGGAVLKLRPVGFQYKSSGQQDIGLIAEEVERYISDLVIYDNEGRANAVKYDKVGLYLLEVVKAQQKRIGALEERLGVLERTIGQRFAVAKEVQR